MFTIITKHHVWNKKIEKEPSAIKELKIKLKRIVRRIKEIRE